MVVTNDAEVDATLRLLRNHGEAEPGCASIIGQNSRLDELQAAVLRTKLDHLDVWNERRRALASFYTHELREGPVALPGTAAGRLHSFHLFVVRVGDRDDFRRRLAAAGVASMVHYPRPLHRHPAYTELAECSERLPMSERLSGEVVSLPLYPELSDVEAMAVVAAVREATSRQSLN